MDWEYVICLYTETHCASRGLRSLTIAAYERTLRQFREYVQVQGDPAPQEVNGRIVMDYVAHLREARNNGDSAVNRAVTVLKNFYRALVAMACGQKTRPNRNSGGRCELCACDNLRFVRRLAQRIGSFGAEIERGWTIDGTAARGHAGEPKTIPETGKR